MRSSSCANRQREPRTSAFASQPFRCTHISAFALDSTFEAALASVASQPFRSRDAPASRDTEYTSALSRAIQ
eukprot:4465612-Pleurochrysis_carterae.AAC.1